MAPSVAATETIAVPLTTPKTAPAPSVSTDPGSMKTQARM